MIKKILLVFICVISGLVSYAEEVKQVTLTVNSSYILLIDESAESFSLTNPNIISIKTMDTFENSRRQIFINTLEEGSTKFGISCGNTSYKYLIKVINSESKDTGDFFEIDIPKGAQNR